MTAQKQSHDADYDDFLRHFDVYSRETPVRLDAVLDHARERCPVSRSVENGGYFLVSTYDDVSTVLREETQENSRFSSRGGKSLPAHQTLEMPPIDTDPPEHREYRRLLNKYFSKQGVAKHEPAIAQLAHSLIDSFIDKESFDLLHDYATALTAGTLCSVILGIEDRDTMNEAMEVVEPIGKSNPGPVVWQNLNDYLAGLIRERRPLATDNVFDAVLAGEVNRKPLTDDQKLGIISVLFLGGMDTTRAQIACIGRHMVLNPGLEGRVRNPDWIRSDLDEFLRLDSVVSAMARKVTRKTGLHGVELVAEDRLLLHYYGANHDPDVFDSPHELVFGRLRNPHLAFAAGGHRCLGSSLARLEIKVAFAALLDRVENLRPVPGSDISMLPGISRMPQSLPVHFDRVRAASASWPPPVG
jgi:cytochrome P450